MYLGSTGGKEKGEKKKGKKEKKKKKAVKKKKSSSDVEDDDDDDDEDEKEEEKSEEEEEESEEEEEEEDEVCKQWHFNVLSNTDHVTPIPFSHFAIVLKSWYRQHPHLCRKDLRSAIMMSRDTWRFPAKLG